MKMTKTNIKNWVYENAENVSNKQEVTLFIDRIYADLAESCDGHPEELDWDEWELEDFCDTYVGDMQELYNRIMYNL